MNRQGRPSLPPEPLSSATPGLAGTEPRPIPFPESNFTYTAPPGLEKTCGHLPCYRGPGVTISCWHFPSWKDRIRFLITGRLWLYLLQGAHPPVSLGLNQPPLSAEPKR